MRKSAGSVMMWRLLELVLFAMISQEGENNQKRKEKWLPTDAIFLSLLIIYCLFL